MISMTAEEVLSCRSPRTLFGSSDRNIYLASYKRLQMQWHPDRSNDPLASKVSSHINYLFRMIESGCWESALTLTNLITNKEFSIPYVLREVTSIGEVFISDNSVSYLFPESNKDLWERFTSAISAITYPKKSFEDNFYRFIPRNVVKFETSKGFLVSFYKGAEQYRLSDLLKLTQLEDCHVSWIITGLFNFALFMNIIQEKTFCGLTTENVFINPKRKTVHILGGWECVTGDDLYGLPQKVYEYLPPSILSQKRASSLIDSYSIRRIGIECLGDKTGVGNSLPKSHILSYLKGKPPSSLLGDYSRLLDEYTKWCVIEKTLPSNEVLFSFNDVYEV